MSEPVRCRNLSDLVRRSAEAFGDKPSLLAGQRRVTWSELDGGVDALALALRGRLDPGERVAIALGNTPEFVTAYFAVLRAGLVAVPVNTGYTGAELAGLAADSGARALFYDAATAPAVSAAMAGDGPVVTLLVDAGPPGAAQLEPPPGTSPVSLAELLAGPGGPASGPVEPSRGAEDLAVLLYTSGTSGRPRGAMLSHRALLANLEQIDRIPRPVVTSDDVVLVVPPLFHVYGLNAGLGAVAWAGATAVLVDRFDPVDTLAELRRRAVTTVVGAPPMYVAWSMLADVGPAFEHVRLAVCGSAPLPAAVMSAITEATGRPVYEGYGLTETAPVLTSTLMSSTAKPGSVGRPLPGVELRVVDEASGSEADEGDPGEVVVRGANLFSGYWPDGSAGPDRDGWFATGDLAYADPDGDLFLVGRLRELIIVSGFNVYPAEVEAVLDAHPSVRESAVVGIPHPYTGESVKALVVPEPGARPDPDELIAHAARSLARFKCPTVVEFVDQLPHSLAGKVARGRLRGAGAAEPVGGGPR